MAAEFETKRLDDRSIVKLFERAYEKGQEALTVGRERALEQSRLNCEIAVSFNTGLPWKVDTSEVKRRRALTFSIVSASITVSLKDKSGRSENVTFNLSRVNASGLTDKFKINTNGHSSGFNSELEASVLKAVHTELSKGISPVLLEDGGPLSTLTNLSEAFAQSYEKICSELADSVTQLKQDSIRLYEEHSSAAEAQREKSIKERDKLLESAKEQINQQQAKIEAEKERLAQEWAKLEVSSHKDARRKQFNSLQQQLADTLDQPVASSNLLLARWAVFFALVTAGGVSAFFGYASLDTSAVPDATTATWLYPAIRSLLLSFTAVAALVGAAAWLRYFYVRDLQAQEEVRRFQNDMARASWVMEASLEIRKEHDEDIPEQWMAGVTEGLFSNRRDGLDESAQALAALMGYSAAVSVGPDGTKFDLNRKGSKALASAAKPGTAD